MRIPNVFIYIVLFLLFLGIFVQSQPFTRKAFFENHYPDSIRDNKINIMESAPDFPGMTVIEWELLECPGDDRHIIMYIPDTYDPDVPSAVVWALHAMVQHIDETQYIIYTGYIQGSECQQVATYGNAIVIVPQGYNGPMLNGYGWDSSNPNSDNEDVEFYRWFIEDYLANNEIGTFGILNINRRRIYIGGYSMGGMINTCAGKIKNGYDYAAMFHLAGGKYFDDPFNVTRKYPAYVTIGADDTISGDSTQTLLDTYVTENHPYYYQEYPGITHMDAMYSLNIDPYHSPKTYFEACWDWLIQWALNEEAYLLNGNVEDLGDYYNFTVTWKDVDGDNPTHQMAVFIDGAKYTMNKEDPNDSDSTDGCIYSCSVSASILGEGIHYYYFEGIEGDEYGTYNIIEAGQGPYEISIAKTEVENFTVSVDEKYPTAEFLVDKTVVSIGEQIQFIFTGTEGNPPAEFLWNFGDGTNSTAKNPIHVYNSIGNFTVSLILTDYDGDQDQVIKTELITVTATEPEPDIPENPVIPSYPLSTLGIVSLLCFLGLLLRYRYLRKKKFDVLDPE